MDCRSNKILASIAMGAALAVPNAAAPDWDYNATLYAWLPGISGKSRFPGNERSATVDASDILGALNMTFMGALEVKKGQWSMLADAIYLDLENTDYGDIGLPLGGSINTSVTQSVVGWQFGFYGGYSLLQDERNDLRAIAGVRYLTVDVGVNLHLSGPLPGGLPGRNFKAEADLLDGVVGLRGRYKLNANWFIPYHVDVGTGDSESTWQAFGGIGYRADWGDISLQYRHLEWNQDSSKAVQSLGFSGGGVAFHFPF